MTDPAPAATWVLLAILYGGGERGATLRDILSAGDYLNHAILTYDELNAALGWLQTAGCVEAHDGRYFPSSDVLAAYRAIDASQRSVSKRWDKLEQFLQGQTASAASTPAVSLDDYTRAVESYIG